ncbi:hypothetical protein M378DRAFT_853803 [Amanita muscaria Koide BX008]|uniref:C2H2-type domain-containing protein n=1 Tax=Amanita muscaria (strain Koide BX008) TaxID=946122 RepID=A0A0C2WJ41_AMAMK|nr:hypothetical protein M378DRAFT_853803 [Amanita muscaria Koide BX008]
MFLPTLTSTTQDGQGSESSSVNSISPPGFYGMFFQLAKSPTWGESVDSAIPLPTTALDSEFSQTDDLAQISLGSTQTENPREQRHICHCGQTFKRQSDLNRHINTSLQHVQPRYRCDICNRSYTRKATLKKHACRVQATATDPSLAV